MSRTDTWIEHTAQQMASWLHPGHMADEEQARILTGILRCVAKTLLPNYNRTIALADLRDFDRVPGRFLPLLGQLLGLDATAGFPQYFTESNWRRFGADAMTIWRSVGIDYRAMLVALVARPVLISDWHVRKTIVNMSPLPWFGLSAPGASPWAEHTVDIHIPDPYGIMVALGGTLSAGEKVVNRSMIRAALNALRPWNQRLDVYWYAFVEDWSQGVFQWSRVSGTAFSLDADAQTQTIGASSILKADVGNATSVWRLLGWDTLVTFNSTGTYDFRARYDSAAGNSALIRITVAASPAASTLTIYRETTSVLVSLGSRAVYIATGIQYLLQLDFSEGITAGQDDIRTYVDGNLILTASGSLPHTHVGTIAFGSGASSEQAIQYTEVAVHPVPSHRVGPNP